MSAFVLPVLLALCVRIVAILEWFFGNENAYSLGYWCETCADVHETGAHCQREMVGVCDDCGKVGVGSWTKLDRFGNCSKGHPASSISRRRFRWGRA